MKKMALCFLLICSIIPMIAQNNSKQRPSYEKEFELLKKDIEIKEQLQKQETAFLLLKQEFEQQKEKVDDSTDRQEKYIQSAQSNMSWWIGCFGAWITLLSIGVAVLGWYINRRSENSAQEVKAELISIQALRRQIEANEREVKKELLNIQELKVQIENIKNGIEQDAKNARKTVDELNCAAQELYETKNKIKPKDASKQEQENVKNLVKEIDNIKPEAELSAEDWFLKGYNAHIKSKLEDACFYYRKSIELDPNSVNTYSNLGDALSDLAMQKSDESLFLESLEKYKKAIELDPNNAAVYCNWGNAVSDLAMQKSDESLFLESLEKYNIAIKLDPDNADTYSNWGTTLARLAKHKSDEALSLESLEKYKKAIGLNPDNADIYSNWGATLLNLAKQKEDLISYVEEIEEKLLKAESLKKGSGSYNLACLYSSLEQPTKALNHLVVCLSIEPDHSREKIEQDDDFDNIKNAPAFKQLLDEYLPNT